MTGRWICSLLIYVCCLTLVLPCPVLAGLGEFSIRDEIELARKFDLVIETRFPVVHDERISGYVRSLVDRLQAVMPPIPFPLKVTVVRSGALNAFASAAGHITVFTGLIVNLESEDELASVLAHELVHVSERHIAKSIENSRLVGAGSLLGILAAVLVGSQGGGKGADALLIGSVAGAQAMQLKYSRENETDADQFGLTYLVKAGFGPQGMVRAFETLRSKQWLGGGGEIPSYLATHPGLNERIGVIQEREGRLPPAVRNRVSDNAAFREVKTLVQAWYTDADTAEAVFAHAPHPTCLDTLGLAIALSRQHQVQAARSAYEKALACRPGDVLVKREYGRFEYEYGSLPAAVRLLQEAVLRRPEDLFAQFYYARAMAEQNEYTTALSVMKRVERAVPHDSEVLEYLGQYQAALGNTFQAHADYAKAFAYRRQFRKYEFHLRKARAQARDKVQEDALAALEKEIAEFRSVLEQ